MNRPLVTLLLLLCLAAKPQEPAKPKSIDGIWNFKLDRMPTDDTASKRVVLTIKWTGTDLRVFDPATDSTYSTKPSQETSNTEKFTIRLPSGVSPRDTEPGTLWTMEFDGHNLSGTAKINDLDVHVRAVKLPTAWECDHKNPSHIATSEDEMRSLTKQYKCVGWHKISSPNWGCSSPKGTAAAVQALRYRARRQATTPRHRRLWSARPQEGCFRGCRRSKAQLGGADPGQGKGDRTGSFKGRAGAAVDAARYDPSYNQSRSC